jgi:hypothetical protein
MDLDRLQRDVQEYQARLADALTASPAVVDKQLIKNMIVQYVGHSGEQQRECMSVLATLLEFNEGERYAVGLRPKRGFFTQLLAGPAVAPDTPGTPHSKSFAEDLVNFMMTEAAQAPSAPAATAVAESIVGGSGSSSSSASTPAHHQYPATNSQLSVQMQRPRMPSAGSGGSSGDLTSPLTLAPFKMSAFKSAQTP